MSDASVNPTGPAETGPRIINQVELVGRVTAAWLTEDGDLLCRLAIPRRRRGAPKNPDGKSFDGATVRISYYLRAGQVLPRRNALVRVKGVLEQQDVREPLSDLLKRATYATEEARQALAALPGPLSQVAISTSRTVVVALEWNIAAPPLAPAPRRPAQEQRGDPAASAERPAS